MSEPSFSAPALCQSQHSRNYVRKTALCFLLMLLGLAPGLYFLCIPLLQQGGSPRLSDLLIGGGLTAFGLLFLVLLSLSLYRWLRPQKGKLARSIFTQMESYVDEEEIHTLFRQIDEDVALGRQIGPIYIGEQWVLGEEAMRLERVRGVFGFAPKRSRGRREFTLILVDQDDNVQTASMASEDLQAAQDYLAGLLPPVATGGLDAYSNYITLSSDEKLAFLAQLGKGEPPQPLTVQPTQAEEAQAPAAFLYTGPDGEPGRAAGWEEILQDIESLQGEQSVRLLAAQPFPCEQGESLGLLCACGAEGYYVAAVFRQGKRPLRFSSTLAPAEAIALFERYYFERQLPDLAGWEDESGQYAVPSKRREGCTLRVDGEKWEQATFEEVEAALDRLDSGKAHFFLLIRSGGKNGCIAVTHEQEKVGYTVGVAQQTEGESRTLETDVQDRLELQQWLSDYYYHGVLPDTVGWLDKTEEAQKARQKG